MNLTLKIKLQADFRQEESLKKTLALCNDACNEISQICFEKKIWGQYKIHHEVYYPVKSSYKLSSQMVIRCIAKVSDSYKLDKKSQRTFKRGGSIAYDSRVLSYSSQGSVVSIWTVDGRVKIPFICYGAKYLPFIRGEADLVFKKGKFYLSQTIKVPEVEIREVDSFIGCDFGISDIVVTSDGVRHTGDWLHGYREKRQRIRSRVQSRGTKGSKRLLKRLSGREKTTARIINHTISKSIVSSAKAQGKGISIEDLSHIRRTSKRRNKRFRMRLGRWSFSELRMFMTYKSRLSGVPLVVVDPAYTSQTCSKCYHIGTRRKKRFECGPSRKQYGCGHQCQQKYCYAKAWR